MAKKEPDVSVLPEAMRTTLVVARCPVCRFQASARSGTSTASEALREHVEYAHPLASGRPQ